MKLEQFKCQQIVTKNIDGAPMEGLGTSTVNDVFLIIYPYDSTSKFQELENLIKHLYHISQTKKM